MTHVEVSVLLPTAADSLERAEKLQHETGCLLALCYTLGPIAIKAFKELPKACR